MDPGASDTSASAVGLASTLAPAALPAFRPAPFGVLVALKWRLLRNRINQLLDESPVRVLVSAAFVIAIWVSLYVLFYEVFVFLRRAQDQAAVAVPYVFHVFFVAMTVLLAFSTAVLCYGALFARPEPRFLLAGPTPPRHIVGIVFVESLFFASWSMVLMGFPLMLAIGNAQNLPWYFFVIFILSFTAFVPIPGALGLLAAWAVALLAPQSARRLVGWAAVLVFAAGLAWWSRLWTVTSGEDEGTAWLDRFLSQLAYLRSAMFPSTWVSQAIKHALHYRPADAVFYLSVTLANALFFSWAAVGVAGRWFQPAFVRAGALSGRRPGRVGSAFVHGVTAVLFFFLPPQVRVLIRKDLKAFLRDPLQWSQLAILFGLLGLYLFYFPRFQLTAFNPRMRILFAFLNYTAVTLIISTFTSRFVFPMVSMEGRQMWLVGLWPLARSQVLWAKYEFALAVTLFAAVTVTALSVQSLQIGWGLGAALTVSMVSACLGLCGLAIGLGARLPNFHERSAARIASGMGGTVNLIASLALVMLSVLLTGLICWWTASGGGASSAAVPPVPALAVGLVAAQAAVGVGVAKWSMSMGARHFARAEF